MAELPLADRPISEVLALLDAREISSRDLVQACLARIGRDGERLNTFLAVGAERALAAADVADGARADGVAAPLLGVPYALEGRIRLGQTAPGSEYVEFQHYLATLPERGILLAINSKNNPDDALEVIRFVGGG